MLKKTDKMILDHFEEIRQEGQNHSYISKLIRNDSIDEFIVYFNQHNLTCSNTKIIQSIFETNSFLIDKSLTLIEYAAFFGSIQIFNFLQLKNAEMKPSLWFYVIHSQNAELIFKLEELGIKPPKNSFITCLCESIKCHHNNISDYIKNNLIKDQIDIENNNSEDEFEFEDEDENEFEEEEEEAKDIKCTESIIDSCFCYHNYEYFPSNFNDKDILLCLCKYDYFDLLKISLDDEELDYERMINRRQNRLLHLAAKNNSVNIVNFLVSQSGIEIDINTFKECTKLTEINISSPINKIPMWCFYSCISLVNVVIPSTVTSIDDFAFFGCSSLTNFEFSSSLTSIGNFAFAGCKSLQRVDLPSSLNSIGCSSFKGCLSLIEVSIPSSVSTIDDYCFEGCSSLKEIRIPSSITKINKFIFRCCSSLENVIIPSSVTIIDDRSFEGCLSLKSIELPSSLIKIGLHSFDSCTSLSVLEIPSNVIEIGESFVSYCTSLIRIQIPPLVTKIENCAFKGCSSLIEVIIPPSVRTIGYDVFKGCSSLNKILIPPSVVSYENKPFECDSITLTESIRKSLTHQIPQFKEIKYIDKKKFNKKSSLTQGSFSHIYSIENESEKLIAKYCILNEKLEDFFLNDIKIEMCIDYPSIIKFVGFSSINKTKHINAIIMERVSKYTFNNILQNFYDDEFVDNFIEEEEEEEESNGFDHFHFTDTLKQIFIIGIAGGLKYLHEIGVTHCDISSSNILIDENFHPKITGFLLSFVGNNLKRNSLCGTSEYIAPETYNEMCYNEKTDVYSFGILMYEILTGSSAFKDYSLLQICYHVVKLNKRPSFDTPIKNSLQNLIERCWDQNPNNRPTFNEIFNEVAYNEDFYLDGVDVQQIKNYVDKLT